MSRSLKILAIETSTTRCEVALALDDHIQSSAQLPETSRPTANLVPTIRDLCWSLGWSPRELNLVCVDLGPGSYTGLRVGLTCAKTLAFAAGAELATVGSLEVVAYNAGYAEPLVEVGFDAARGQVFAGQFRRQDDAWAVRREVRILRAEDWVQILDPSALVLGPALAKYCELVPTPFRVADESLWWPHADTLVRLGFARFQSGPPQPYWTLEPLYLRPSAAEEKRGAAQP